jgi:hypothetical protein
MWDNDTVILRSVYSIPYSGDNTVRAMPEYGLPIELPDMFSVESADAPG